MILGIFQRHYKIYSGASFFSFHSKNPESLTTFIGNNGCGKSSILEALDTFFNNRPFNINIKEKKSEAFVAPLFLLSEQLFKKLSKPNQKIVEVIDKFLWEELLSRTTNYNAYKNYFEFRDSELQRLKDTHYLLTVTKEFDSDSKFFFTFTSAIIKKIKNDLTVDYTSKENRQLIAEIKKLYSYIYIPVESSIEDFLKLETRGMQNLVDKKIADEIQKVLTEKRITRTRNSKQFDISLLYIINEHLENYIDDIEKEIKKIDKTYDFRKESNTKKKLTANDLKNQIIQSYLSQRTLRKEKKTISTLSAGERKKALVDIAYSLLSNSKKREKFVLLAIDEPESSLHISNCFDQFKRIEEMSSSDNCQVITTTHWYGSLPIIRLGSLIHIDNQKSKPKHNLFSFRNYFEERGTHPNDIQLKSFYDLSSSIISSIRHYETNWLIVEGTDDLNYVSKFLSRADINIIPVGGASIVRLIYDFLFVPLSHKSEKQSAKGKIYCLIDTDHSSSSLQHKSDTKSGRLSFRRLQLIDGHVELIRDERPEKIPLEIEEVLDPKDFYTCLTNIAKKQKNKAIIDILKKFQVIKGVNFSIIKGDDSMLEYNGSAKDQKTAKKAILDFIEINKENLSQEFRELPKPTKPLWISEIEDFFK